MRNANKLEWVMRYKSKKKKKKGEESFEIKFLSSQRTF